MVKYNAADYVGLKFGHLTLMSDEKHKNSKGNTVYRCVCDCGNECFKKISSLVIGHDKTCGKCNLSYIDKTKSKKGVKDITGKRFGILTAIRIVGEDRFKRKKWLFKCDCGNEIICSSNNVSTGNTKSCGCLKSIPRKRLDLIGKRFGRLVVVAFDKYERNAARWLCKCDCGNIVSVRTGHLRGGRTNSCGCLREERHTGTAFVSKWANDNKKIFEGTCVKCGSTKCIHSHHILPRSKYPQYVNSYANGITLCYRCHMKLHQKYGEYCDENSLADFLGLSKERASIIRHMIEFSVDRNKEHLLEVISNCQLILKLDYGEE